MKQLRYEQYKAELKKCDLLSKYHLAMGTVFKSEAHLKSAKTQIDMYMVTSDKMLKEMEA